MKIILATRNESKVEQIRGSFRGSPFEIITLTEAKIKGEAIEDGETLEQNAFAKASYAYDFAPSDMWTMADDTGLFISALGGEPGIQAAYWGGPELSTEERMAYCLKQMEGVTDRSATFRTVVAMISPDGEKHFFTGEVRGQLLKVPAGVPQPKMPYSALFKPDGSELVWAQMTIDEENQISHRGIAFAKACQFLKVRC